MPFARFLVDAFSLICILAITSFIFMLYNSPEKVESIACTLQTHSVNAYSTCLYNFHR